MNCTPSHAFQSGLYPDSLSHTAAAISPAASGSNPPSGLTFLRNHHHQINLPSPIHWSSIPVANPTSNSKPIHSFSSVCPRLPKKISSFTYLPPTLSFPEVRTYIPRRPPVPPTHPSDSALIPSPLFI
ncbi:hypothetical protein BO78DRAFT_70602 [Aspergillus sclerotiicarbonarius CBS 121057]|uniref:Uncharacterized protein n=1 Tax=Aspergillus sclerotiicarbonarius (strain CBS 121057 / IBT 28362) TaxID=1448318 RepID=A0A319FNU8_ASPSB|nr:hypothetical protein BO78DRAFT_70602 [Aspergillus sclerotiicarbonarius CBS 121057]